MALVKKRTVINRNVIVFIVVIVVGAAGYFLAQRFINPEPPVAGPIGGGADQIITDFGETILDDPRFLELRPFGQEITVDPDEAGNPNPFE